MASSYSTLVKNGDQWLAVTMGDLEVLFGKAVFPPLMINPGGPGPVGPITSSTQINNEYVMSYHDLQLALDLITSGYTGDGYGNYHSTNNYDGHRRLEYMFSKFDDSYNHGDSSTTTIYNDKITWDSFRTACAQPEFATNPILSKAIRMYMPKVIVHINIGLGSWSGRMSYYGHNSGTVASLKVFGFTNNASKSNNSTTQKPYGQRFEGHFISVALSEKKGSLAYGNVYYNAGFETTLTYDPEVVDASSPQRPWRWDSTYNTFTPSRVGAFAVASGVTMSGDYYYGGSWDYPYIKVGGGEMFSLHCTSTSGYEMFKVGNYNGFDFPGSALITPTFVSGDTFEMTVNYSMGCRLHSGSQPGGGDGPDYSSLLGLTGILGMPGGASINNYISELSSNNATILEDDE